MGNKMKTIIFVILLFVYINACSIKNKVKNLNQKNKLNPKLERAVQESDNANRDQVNGNAGRHWAERDGNKFQDKMGRPNMTDGNGRHWAEREFNKNENQDRKGRDRLP